MVEVLFCLSIILLLSSLSMPQFMIKRTISIEEQYISVRSLLEEAKTLALIHHQKVMLDIQKDTIIYQSDIGSRKLMLEDSFYFDNVKEIYFNEFGNINQGNTITLCNQEHCKSIVFNVGSGDFYLK